MPRSLNKNSSEQVHLKINLLAKYALSTIDEGNSHPHIGTFSQGKLLSVAPLKKEQKVTGEKVYSTVTRRNKNNFEPLWSEGQVKEFCHMPVHYGDGLGQDRLYQSSLLYASNSDQKQVLIDAGTFITIDLIDQGGFRGGFIFPGVQTFLSSYTKGSLLPELSKADLKMTLETSWPQETDQAILSACSHYILGIISSFSHILKESHVTLTGGDASHIEKILKNNNYHYSVEPHLIHYALYYLYDSLKQELKNKKEHCL